MIWVKGLLACLSIRKQTIALCIDARLPGDVTHIKLQAISYVVVKDLVIG